MSPLRIKSLLGLMSCSIYWDPLPCPKIIRLSFGNAFEICEIIPYTGPSPASIPKAILSKLVKLAQSEAKVNALAKLVVMNLLPSLSPSYDSR